MGFPYRRICSWGPILAITLISLVIVSATYTSIQLYGLPGYRYLKLVNFCVMYPESFWILFVYFRAMLGPGFVPPGWTPSRKQDQKNLQYCDACRGFKPPRCHHCKSCGHCVMKMDHHCVWINVCVGHENHTMFVAFLFFLSVGCVHAVILNSIFLYRLFDRAFLYYPRILPITPYYLFLVISGIAFSIGAALGVLILLFVQLKGILANKTQIEEWICDKARDRRRRNKELDPFIYPYDLGWKKNFTQVVRFALKPVGNGYRWPVRKDCSQFTFTLEQIDQKIEKAAMAVNCNVVKEFNGKKCSLAYGLRAFCCMPCMEPGVAVNAGDIVVITRWRRNWVYGTSVRNKDKGWIPRACVKLKTDSYTGGKEMHEVSKDKVDGTKERQRRKLIAEQ